ncbi:MAG: AbrB/MazE/SpoVT family DNA-binding domain-containing protein [Peptococcaceae bacterium]|jgi:AbrB family looped-hinge helix DNA binding protein|nr:AbrB/MazE/SpoVT family DNA-binding domain-containing protein [Peptococcaceae bacterium]
MQAAEKMNGTATVTTKGQVTIPVDIRKAMNIREGDQLFFEMDCDVVKVRKLSPLDVLFNVVGPKLKESFPTPEDFDEYLRTNRKRLFESIYGELDGKDCI